MNAAAVAAIGRTFGLNRQQIDQVWDVIKDDDPNPDAAPSVLIDRVEEVARQLEFS